MYSQIPVPRVEWSEENRRYSLCFFPLIGVIIGGLLCGWYWLCSFLGIGKVLFSAVACLIPIAVTGGIHLDGFCDVIDAQSSHSEKERKLAIMSDPHIGSFAVIGLGCYFLLQLGLFSQVEDLGTVAVVALSYTLSRSLSGLCAVTFKSAKSEGALQSFAKPAHKGVTVAVLCTVTISAVAGMAMLSPIAGAGSVVGAGVAVLFYRIFAYKEFCGITGDLAGFFLQICEIMVLVGAVMASFIR